MLYGNKEKIDILEKYLNSIKEGKVDFNSSFFLLNGPSGLGKKTAVIDLVKNYLKEYYMSDFLWIRDLSEYIGKKHNIKVSGDDEIIEYGDGEKYIDLGTREINEWLSKSAVGKNKILFIENIERMTNSAINAFLKTSEEPGKGVIIIATTTNKNLLLETIISRAVVIDFFVLLDEEMFEFVKQLDFDISRNNMEFLVNMALGRPGNMVRLIEKIGNDKEILEDIKQVFENISQGILIYKNYYLLQKLKGLGLLEIVIDGLISYFAKNENNDLSQKRIKIKKMMNANINVDNLVFAGLL